MAKTVVTEWTTTTVLSGAEPQIVRKRRTTITSERSAALGVRELLDFAEAVQDASPPRIRVLMHEMSDGRLVQLSVEFEEDL